MTIKIIRPGARARAAPVNQITRAILFYYAGKQLKWN